MSNDQTALTPAPKPPPPAEPPKIPVLRGERGLEIKDLDGLWRVSQYIAKSGLAPKGIETPEAIFVAIELGMELGLPPMMALQNIAVINGRPAVYGDIPLALVRSSGLLEEFSEEEIGKRGTESWGFKATCKRQNRKFSASIFTVLDAKQAGLWGKPGVWTQYPQRMLRFRARSFLLRDEFGDVLKGVKTVEEVQETSDDEERRFAKAKPVSMPLAPPPEPEPTQAQSAASSPDEDGDLGPQTGSAPEDKAESAPPDLEATGPRSQLKAIVLEAGGDWDDFKAWGQSEYPHGNDATGMLAWDTLDGFRNFPDKAAAYFIRGKGFIKAAIASAVASRRKP